MENWRGGGGRQTGEDISHICDENEEEVSLAKSSSFSRGGKAK